MPLIERLTKLKHTMPLLRRIPIGRHIPTSFWMTLSRVRYWGKARYCPICNSYVRAFSDAGYHYRRKDGECPICNSWERHRLAWYFIQHETELLKRKSQSLLHLAPEPQISRRFTRNHQLRYITADLYRTDVSIRLDLTRLPFGKETLDAIYCSHVLEHIGDDIAAMTEMYRLLKHGGWSIILVPLKEGNTVEDATVVDPFERVRLFGQEDHVRIYGNDIIQRLEHIGFGVRRITPSDLMSAHKAHKMGVTTECLFFCVK